MSKAVKKKLKKPSDSFVYLMFRYEKPDGTESCHALRFSYRQLVDDPATIVGRFLNTMKTKHGVRLPLTKEPTYLTEEEWNELPKENRGFKQSEATKARRREKLKKDAELGRAMHTPSGTLYY